MLDQPEAISLKKTGSLSSSSHWLSVSWPSTWGLPCFTLGCWVTWSCANNHNRWINDDMGLLDPEYIVLPQAAPATSSNPVHSWTLEESHRVSSSHLVNNFIRYSVLSIYALTLYFTYKVHYRIFSQKWTQLLERASVSENSSRTLQSLLEWYKGKTMLSQLYLVINYWGKEEYCNFIFENLGWHHRNNVRWKKVLLGKSLHFWVLWNGVFRVHSIMAALVFFNC